MINELETKNFEEEKMYIFKEFYVITTPYHCGYLADILYLVEFTGSLWEQTLPLTALDSHTL